MEMVNEEDRLIERASDVSWTDQLTVPEEMTTGPWDKLYAHLSFQAFPPTTSAHAAYPFVFVSHHAPRSHHATGQAPWEVMLEIFTKNAETQLTQRIPWMNRLLYPFRDRVQRGNHPGRSHLPYKRKIGLVHPAMSQGEWIAQISIWHASPTSLTALGEGEILSLLAPSTAVGTYAMYQGGGGGAPRCYFHVASPNPSVEFNPGRLPDYFDPELCQIVSDGFARLFEGISNCVVDAPA